MKRIFIAIAAIAAVALCCVSFLHAKDVKVSKADNDKIVTAHVGDVLVVKFVPLAHVSCDSGSGLCLVSKTVRGTYRIDVEKAGKSDVVLQRCYGNHCTKLLVHVDAQEAPKNAPENRGTYKVKDPEPHPALRGKAEKVIKGATQWDDENRAVREEISWIHRHLVDAQEAPKK